MCKNWKEECTKLIESVGGIDKIKGIGARCPNGNYYTRNIEFAPNLPWEGVVPFAKMLTEALEFLRRLQMMPMQQ